MIIELFIPCFINRFFPNTALNMVKVLEKLDCQVNYNFEQSCCGAVAYQAGYALEAKQLAQKMVSVFTNQQGFVVTPSAYCTHMVRNIFAQLLEEKDQKACYALQKRTFEFSEFLIDVLETQSIAGAKLEGIATYHDSCQALRACGIYDAPRILLNHVQGLTLREMRKDDFCCGFGGGLPNRYSELATSLAEQKIDQATATQADFLISTDMTCLMHLDAYIQKNLKNIQVLHIADVLASGW